MDLRSYYEKIRATEEQIDNPYPVVVSEATSEGGRAGVLSEVPRKVAARMIADGRARLASDEESRGFRAEMVAAKAQYEREEAARRMQVMVIPAPDSRTQKDRS